MLTEIELEALFLDLESDRVERKSVFASKKEEIRQAICAFANDYPNYAKPGVVFVGQNNDGTCTNLAIDDRLLLDLGGMKSDGKIIPLPVMAVSKQQLKGCELAVVVVAPSEQPPVRLDGRAWIRVGPRRAIATREDEKILAERQIWHNTSFDMKPCPSATIDDLDLIRFEQEYLPSAVSAAIMKENNRSIEEKLRSLRLMNARRDITSAAILLLGRVPRDFFPCAYTQFLRIDGISLTDAIIDEKEISGTVQDQIRQIDDLLKIHIKQKAVIAAPRRTESPDYPLAALEQLTRNALLHRSYESDSPVKIYWFNDRIEIHNPGGLYGDVNPETIWQNVTSYRNPGIAEALKTLGVVDRFGFGLVKAGKALEDNGNPELEFTFVTNFVQFTVRATP